MTATAPSWGLTAATTTTTMLMLMVLSTTLMAEKLSIPSPTVAASALPVIPATATSTNLQEDPELPKHRIGELESSIGFYQAIELVEHSLLYSKQSKYQTYVHGEWECRGIIMPSLVGRMQTCCFALVFPRGSE